MAPSFAPSYFSAVPEALHIKSYYELYNYRLVVVSPDTFANNETSQRARSGKVKCN